MVGSFNILILTVFVAVFTNMQSRADNTSAPNAQYGINLYGPKDWNRTQPFLNVMKTSRKWISQTTKKWDDGRELPVDENGYVTKLEPEQIAVTLMLTEVGENFPGGEYVFLYDGEGDFEWKGNSRLVKAEPGRHLVNVTPASQGFVQMNLKKLNPTNYPRNMRFVKIEFEKDWEEKYFAPWFLELWRDVRTIRYMDMMLTNNSTQSEWSKRPKPSDRTYSVKGIAIEDIIRLSRLSNTNPWINIPFHANDEYVRQMAIMLRDGIPSGLTTYYELSNEVWNGIFKQTRDSEKLGAELNLAPEKWKAGIMYYSKRCSEIFTILDEVYKDKPKTSYRKVLATQAANIGLTRIILESYEVYKKADSIAIAPYISFNVALKKGKSNPLEASEVENWTLDQLFEYLNQKTLPDCFKNMDEHKALADKYGLELIAYEGGQHLTAIGEANKNKKLIELLTNANRDPRMGSLYEKYLDYWNKTGGGLFCLFSEMSPYSVHGSWGLLEYVGQNPASSPKYMAVKKWVKKLR